MHKTEETSCLVMRALPGIHRTSWVKYKLLTGKYRRSVGGMKVLIRFGECVIEGKGIL
jgi:hypothetical protein